ncbi:isochorismatase family protein [Niveomyces insectorum RCEF 264]|uniref:Isochorismatase family protein n=1 Tax=Niveomyces insectorum RCEF 264 TaxID=1081102 RepID=A0A167QQS3_9HYPO|nr:isochorismatase family protein [Niveomyces insectorum RCEF 264]
MRVLPLAGRFLRRPASASPAATAAAVAGARRFTAAAPPPPLLHVRQPVAPSLRRCAVRFLSTAMSDQHRRPALRPALFVCDMQEKFRHAIFEFDKVVLTTRKLLRAAALLDIPVFVTTQNRARLGDTVPELAALYAAATAAGPDAAGVEAKGTTTARLVVDADKTRFSMWTPDVEAAFQRHVVAAATSAGPSAVPAVVLVGIEAHICVTQTALDLLAAGHRVYVLADGVSSCNCEEVGIALARLRAAGAVVTTSESWLYEHLGDAAVPTFRGMVGLVKETSADTRTALSALLSPKI